MDLATETRDAAYHQLQPRIGNTQALVLRVLSQSAFALTNNEIAADLKWSINKVTGRVYELRELNLVVADGKRICSISGESCMTWKVRVQ
jgi:hypothetical protein